MEPVLARNIPGMFGTQGIWRQHERNVGSMVPRYVVPEPGTSGVRYPRVYIRNQVLVVEFREGGTVLILVLVEQHCKHVDNIVIYDVFMINI